MMTIVWIWLGITGLFTFVFLVASFDEMAHDPEGWLVCSVLGGILWPVSVLHAVCGGISWLLRLDRRPAGTCPNGTCGAQVRPGAAYCVRCGTKLT